MRRPAKCQVAVLLAAAIAGPAPSAQAELCTIDAVPAATLLVPYFEVSIGEPSNKNRDTAFSVENTSPNKAFAQVRIFNDWGLRVIEFPVSLPAFGSVTISLSDVFNNGNLPPGAAGCVLPSDVRSSEPLAAAALGDEVLAVGYILIDSVREACWDGTGERFISGGLGVATNDNILMGEYYYTQKKYLGATRMIAIEAGNIRSLTAPGSYTFYGPEFGFDARDNREPLGTTYGARFDATKKSSAYLHLWRDPQSVETQIRRIDFHQEASAASRIDTSRIEPLATQEVRIGKSEIRTGSRKGWLSIDFGNDQAAVIVRQDKKKRRGLYPASLLSGSTCRTARAASTRLRRLGSAVNPPDSPRPKPRTAPEDFASPYPPPG